MPHDKRSPKICLAAIAASVLAVAVEVAGAEDAMIYGGLSCEAATGPLPEPLDLLCQAVAGELGDDSHLFRLVLLSANDNGMRARLDRLEDGVSRPGPEVEFSVMDRELAPRDYRKFAASLVRISQQE